MTPSSVILSAYRAPMRTLKVDDGTAAEWAIAAGVVGLDGAVRTEPESLDDALAAVDLQLDERTARRIRRFTLAPAGSLVWTRDRSGGLHLGRLGDGQRYVRDAVARQMGLPHQRDCDWAAGPVPVELVPAAVIETFARGGRNWQQIRADGGASARLWEQLDGA
jgi:hypothetical protein